MTLKFIFDKKSCYSKIKFSLRFSFVIMTCYAFILTLYLTFFLLLCHRHDLSLLVLFFFLCGRNELKKNKKYKKKKFKAEF